MADEENGISFCAKQETLAEEKRSVRMVDVIPITWYFIHISFLFLIEGVPSVYLGLAIWSIFLSHRDSLPLYKWMASLGCSIRGINDNRVSVVGVTLDTWCYLTLAISLFGWDPAIFSIIPYLPMSVITVINTVGFVSALVLLNLVLPYVGGITLLHYSSVADRPLNSALAVAAAFFCQIIGCLLVFFACHWQSGMNSSIMAGILIGSAMYITVVLILTMFARNSGSQMRKLLDTTGMICGLVGLILGAAIYLHPDGTHSLQPESVQFLQGSAMLCAMPLYLLCFLTKKKELNSTLMKQ